jgi:organic radical activating enzyme
MIPIMEVFTSIQGEGSNTGNISVFIRVGGCNFSCAGFKVPYKDPKTGEEKFGCDSYYSVDAAFRKNWNIVESFEEIVDMVDNVIPKYPKAVLTKPDIVITGGEPTLYWKNAEFQKLLAYYVSRNHNVTIETNASQSIDFKREYQKQIKFSMSVKLSVSGEPEHKRINIDNITNIIENSPTSYLKFVVAKDTIDETEKEIDAILKEIPVYGTVYLMPLGDINETLNYNAEAVINLCIKKGFKYSDRTHIRIWGNLQGV